MNTLEVILLAIVLILTAPFWMIVLVVLGTYVAGVILWILTLPVAILAAIFSKKEESDEELYRRTGIYKVTDPNDIDPDRPLPKTPPAPPSERNKS